MSMKNLLTAAQMREADAHTIRQQSISSTDLMERAARAFVREFMQEVPDRETALAIICGPGNNGGDGLAIARMLVDEGYSNCEVFLASFSVKQSSDYLINLDRLREIGIAVTQLDKVDLLWQSKATVIVDAILGSGLNKPLTGDFLTLATLVNQLNRRVIAVDVPTGFYTEGQLDHYNGIKAELAIALQQPKLNFFFPESMQAFARFKVVDIGLDEAFINVQSSRWKLTTQMDVAKLLVPRKSFSHKGTYGHALLIAGNENTMGAALLGAGACLHTGAGLTTLCLPPSGLTALNTALPEVMALPRSADLSIDIFDQFEAIAIGPGLGTGIENERLLEQVIGLKRPLVIDADGLNLLARRQDILAELAPGSILTPHLKEFDRLFGAHANWWGRVATASEEAAARKIVIVLKNQYTFVCWPNGEIHINPSGNPAMASGGMGDVLTGTLVALLAQGYAAADAGLIGVYLHGAAGDHLAKKSAVVSASQLVLQIPKTIRKILKGIK